MKKRKMNENGNPIYMLIPALLLILFVTDQAFPQRSWNRRRSGETAESNLPEQRAPLVNSRLNLGDIPYKIVYESYQETGGRNNWEICLIDANGSNFKNLTKTPDTDEFYPHASPDGTRICFVAVEGDTRESRTRNVYVMNIDGSGLAKVAGNAYQPCWSGDGKRLAYMKGEYSRYSDSSWSNRGLEIYDLKTKETRQHPNRGLALLFNLCWSPDGNWFTATSQSRSRGGGNIVFRADDTTEMPLGIHGCRPDISPSGREIVWNQSDNVIEIGSLNLSSPQDNVIDSKPVIACQQAFKIYHADWSPDGRHLIFSYGPASGDQAVGRRAAGWNICVCELETGTWVQITSDGKHNKEPDWVPIRSTVSRDN